MKRTLFTLILFLFLASLSLAQKQITGNVLDNTGEPLIGVNVVIKGTDMGSTTDYDGNYILKLPSGKNKLVFSYIGYKTQEVDIGDRNVVDVILVEDLHVLQEVVVVGYGVQKKSDLTGSISKIKSEDIRKGQVSNLSQALQGKISGVQVTPVSGKPGENAIIRIRGTGTLNDASPLFVVDGMFVDDISFLDPDDVESVEVLKDASATAIFGSRGANGVIMITTNKGSNESSSSISFSSSYGIQNLIQKISLVNAHDYATLANEVAENERTGKPFDDPEIYGTGTDWQDEIFQQALMSKIKLSASGGSDNLKYNISIGHLNQEGIVKGSKYQRTTFRLNNSYKIKKWLDFGHNLSFNYKKEEIAANVISTAYKADPTVEPIDSLGKYGNTSIRASVGNPVASINYNNNKWWGYRTVGNIYVDIKPFKNLIFKSSLGVDFQHNQGKNFIPVFYVSPIQENKENILSVNTNRTFSWLWENTATYNKEIGSHKFTLLGGITAQKVQYENLGAYRKNLPGETSELLFLDAGEADGQTNYNSAWEWSILSYLFRTNYIYKNKYLATVSLRADGSSKFGENNRYGYFPSFALGWNLGHEEFIKQIDLISRLKLRASWGVVGNEKTGAYASRAVVSSNLNAVFGTGEDLNYGASVISQSNPDLRWESTTQSDIGIEVGLLEDKLISEFDFYRRVTDGILIDVPIPDYVGSANNPVLNAAEVLNQGIDLSLKWRDKLGKINYNIGGLFSTVHNEVLGLGEGKEKIEGGNLGVGGKLGTKTIVGKPIGSFFGYKMAGIFQSEEEIGNYPSFGTEVPGDIRYEDTNQDGVLDSDDRVFLGDAIPKVIYGFNLGVGYKGISLSIDLAGQFGNKIINAKKMARFGTYNFEESYLDRWTPENPSDTEPRATNGGNNYKVSDRFIEDGSFTRIRNIQLSYSLSKSLIKKLRLSQFRVYISGNNLFTFTNYSGYTPEVISNNVTSVGIDSGVYPVAKSLILGFKVIF